MKTKLTMRILIFMLLFVFLTISSYATPLFLNISDEFDNELYMQFMNNPYYVHISLFTSNVQVDEDYKAVTFNARGFLAEHTNYNIIFVINEDTQFSIERDHFNSFLNGEFRWLDVDIRVEDLWRLRTSDAVFGLGDNRIYISHVALSGRASDVFIFAPSDVVNATRLLTSLGVWDILFLNTDDIYTENGLPNLISRASMVSIICRVIDITDIQKSETVFSDVPYDHWASGYIAYLNELGIINGVGDGTFRPDEYATYDQLIRVLISILGYDENAISRGGFPYGFRSVANELGVIGNEWNIDNFEFLTLQDLELVIYRAFPLLNINL